MKKNVVWALSALVMMTMMCVGFTSCGSDGDDSPNNPGQGDVGITQVGDIYYLDGTCSRTLMSGKTPIGIVVCLGSDGASEGKHGLVMALRNSGKKGYANTPAPTDRSLFPVITSYSEALADFNGVAKTKWLAEHDSPVSTSVAEYGVNTPGETSGWFVPSVGQWLAAINAFGANVTKDGKIGDAKFVDAMNSALAKVGTDGTDFESLTTYAGSGQLGYFQTSSYGPYYSSHTGEQTGYGFCFINFGATQNVYFKTNNGMSSFYIRPFLAF